MVCSNDELPQGKFIVCRQRQTQSVTERLRVRLRVTTIAYNE